MSITLKKNALIINKKKTFLTSKLEAIQLLIEALYKYNATANEVLTILPDIKELDLIFSSDPTLQEEEEFVGFFDFLRKKITAETTGEPDLFVCAGCGIHAFVVGKNFIVGNMLYRKQDIEIALSHVKEEALVSYEELIKLEKKLDDLEFREFISIRQRLSLTGETNLEEIHISVEKAA